MIVIREASYAPSSLTDSFSISRFSYAHTSLLGLLCIGGYLGCGILALFALKALWSSYPHPTFSLTLALHWQSLLCIFLVGVILLAIGGVYFTARFLWMVREGLQSGMVRVQDGLLYGRDLAPTNLLSILRLLLTLGGYFCLALAACLPGVALSEVQRLDSGIFSTPLNIGLSVLCVLGLAVSLFVGIGVLIGVVGVFSVGKSLGREQAYKLDKQLNLRVDGSILTFIYPGVPETMVDLAQLEDAAKISLWKVLTIFESCSILSTCQSMYTESNRAVIEIHDPDRKRWPRE